MFQKKCPFCNGDSFSSYNDPNWRCPYCGKIIGQDGVKQEIFKKECKRKVVNFNDFRNNV